MKKLFVYISILLSPLSAIAQENISFGNNYSETECLGVESDGTQILRVWTYGVDANDAANRCKRDAVYYAIFKGVGINNGGCNKEPIISNSNVKNNYATYFDLFFTEGGDYLNYIAIDNNINFTKKRDKKSEQVKFGITVKLLYSKLTERLTKDGITQ